MSALLSSLGPTDSLSPLPPMASRKRPAPSLLPAFEPSSSPGFSRPSKRPTRTTNSESQHNFHRYPTPIPSSTTGVLSSPPPQILSRCVYYPEFLTTERTPLSNVPSVTLPEDGEVLKMGRSSISSNYQLSVNRLISRVHVEAQYIAATTPLEPNRITIKCIGWNGLKLHCSARTWELAKGDTFTSETEYAEIIMDVHDVRILIKWPSSERRESSGNPRDSPWEDLASSSGRYSAIGAHEQAINSSPLGRDQIIKSPESPTPRGPHISKIHTNSTLDYKEPEAIQIYEDAPSVREESVIDYSSATTQPSTCFVTSPSEQEFDLSDPENDNSGEENDQIVHSFGPSGTNISHLRLSFATQGSQSPPESKRPTNTSSASPSKNNELVINHAINQLAFSLKSSTPLSELFAHLPTALKQDNSNIRKQNCLTLEALRSLLNLSPCVGEIIREGKDAAGKVLESQYYYLPEEDGDISRRAAVQDLQKPSLRSCRKQHKVGLSLLFDWVRTEEITAILLEEAQDAMK